jgi:hypothetical protein
VLDSLITSKTRLKMLLKFFTNSTSSAYLRGLAQEFGESTNAVRHELNNLSRAGYLVSYDEGRTVRYRANTEHPLYNEVKNLVHKYLGIDKIIDNILSRIGELHGAYIVGDYALGVDSGTIELVLVGNVNEAYLKKLTDKAEGLLQRKIRTFVISHDEFVLDQKRFDKTLLVWGRPK